MAELFAVTANNFHRSGHKENCKCESISRIILFFFSTYPLTFYTLFGLWSTSWLSPQPGKALQSHPSLPQHCVTGAGSSGAARAQREKREDGVTSLRCPALQNAADQSWQGPAQRGPTAVLPPEPAWHTLGTRVRHHCSQAWAALHCVVPKAGWAKQWVLGAIHSSLNCIIL